MFRLAWHSLGTGLPWQAFVAALIFYCIGRAIGERKHKAEGKTLVVERASWTGRIGVGLGVHCLLSMLNGIVGYNVLISIFCMVLSLPLMLFGAKVELPEHVKSWPRSVVARAQEMFTDAEESMKKKIHDATEGIKERVHDRKEAVMERFGQKEGGAPDLRAIKERIEKEAREEAAYQLGRSFRKAIFFWE